MTTCPKLQCVPQLRQFILELANTFAFDLWACGAYLRLELVDAEHYLVIENLGACRVSIARYLVSGPSRVADPELVLYTAYCGHEAPCDQAAADWVPIERLQRLGGWAIYADINSQGMLMRAFDVPGQQELAEYGETSFMHDLRTQGWLIHGYRSTVPRPYLTPEEQWLRGITFAYNDERADPTTSLLMQKLALRLAADHDMDLSRAGLQLVLSLPDLPEQLLLTNLGNSRIAVTRCIVEDDGQLVPDPDMVFHVTEANRWQPEELLHSPAVWAEYVAAVGKSAAYATDGEVNFVSFTEYWAQHLIDAGWVTQSQKLFELDLTSGIECTSIIGNTSTAFTNLNQTSCMMSNLTPGRNPNCQSTNHHICYGEVWQCSACHKRVCCAEGTDNHPELCDDCWATRFHPQAVVANQGVSFTAEGTLELLCNCPDLCGARLELTADGVLALEDNDGFRISLMLPEWLEMAMRTAVRVHLQTTNQSPQV